MMPKHLFLVGGNSGIGQSLIFLALERGYEITATYHMVKPSIPDRKGLYWQQLDVTEEKAVAECVALAVHRLPVDTVMYLPAIPSIPHDITRVSTDEFLQHLAVGVTGFFFVAHAFAQQLKKKHPMHFITVLTEYCTGRPPSGLVPYITAKYALEGLSKSLVSDLARYGARVNMVSPGVTQTDFITNVPPKALEWIIEETPLKRLATPEDVAKTLLWLDSSDANYLNGVNILVNGGHVLH